MQEVFKSQPSDVIIASFMKSGTTWLKALAFAVLHREKYYLSSHPLLKLNPHDCVLPIIEHHYATRDEHYLESVPFPRVLGTHVSYSMLPDSIKTSTSKIVYICRDPKDVLVSLWHMVTKFEWFNKPFTFAKAFELFCEGRMPYGPVWDHVLEYYTKSIHSPKKILILKYEEMLKDPSDGVVKMANFIGCPFSEDEMKIGWVEKIVELCSFNKLKDLDVNKNGSGAGNVPNNYYFRKAVVGDWQNFMTPEMANTLDEITKEKFSDSTFTY
ncbi:Sulfotransferase [Rhynchospora pubera]|uniref:Sulfotransferase n=1 Tax=Rhynchospora pubera TaxID=906938 RepID=A0AAV8HAS3_9POAL|nr:Sulfotransferase [Rhynchospora pubera]